MPISHTLNELLYFFNHCRIMETLSAVGMVDRINTKNDPSPLVVLEKKKKILSVKQTPLQCDSSDSDFPRL